MDTITHIPYKMEVEQLLDTTVEEQYPDHSTKTEATKEITATIPYTTFNAMVNVFELNCQDDLDSLIQNLIDQALDEQLEITI